MRAMKKVMNYTTWIYFSNACDDISQLRINDAREQNIDNNNAVRKPSGPSANRKTATLLVSFIFVCRLFFVSTTWNVLYIIYFFSGIWKNLGHNNARFSYSTNALSIGHLPAFIGISWIKDEGDRFGNVMELLITALMYIVRNMTTRMGFVQMEMSE